MHADAPSRIMARCPSLSLSEYGHLSSPDPLASSQHDEDYRYATRSPSPLKQPPSSPSRRQRPLGVTPPRTSQSRWMNVASPSKTVTEQNLSPWKIRVTVETEREEIDTQNVVPSSRTIMVPLRDASSPMEDRARGVRGRGSQPSSAKPKRSATPVRKNSRNRNRRQSVTDLNITVLGDDGDSNDWTKRKSPRKRKSTPSRKSQPDQEQSGIETSKPTTAEKAMRRSTRSMPNIEIREDTDADEEALIHDSIESDSPELRGIDLNRVSVRSRSISFKQRPPNLGSHEVLDEPEDDAVEDKPLNEKPPVRALAPSTSYPTPDPSVQDDQEVSKPAPDPLPDSHEPFDTILESEGFTMIDLESIPSARNFFSSPTAAQETAHTTEPCAKPRKPRREPYTQPSDQNALQARQIIKIAPQAIPSYLIEGESDISSNVPSSPPFLSQPQSVAYGSLADTHNGETTPPIHSSPKLPAPPRVAASQGNRGVQPRKSTPPTLAKVVKAGIALQGVLSPNTKKTVSYSPGGTPKERLDNLFEGFDSGTRRELRAGLRFGEELAKRQRSNLDVKEVCSSDVLQKRYSTRTQAEKSDVSRLAPSSGQKLAATQVCQVEAFVQQSPSHMTATGRKSVSLSQVTPSYEKITQRSQPRQPSSLRKETVLRSSTPQTNNTGPTSQAIEESQRLREAQWQREREAVSTEIENASSSQVMVIDSDEEDSTSRDHDTSPTQDDGQIEQDNVDIWCEEAASCDQRSSNFAARRVRTYTDIQTSRQQQAQDPVRRSRRSMIPNTWRKLGSNGDDASCLTNGDMTGLFEHEPRSKIKFGAAEIDRQRRQFSSGSFDIDRMAGTPYKPEANFAANESRATIDYDSTDTVDSVVQQLQNELQCNQIFIDGPADSSQASEVDPSFSEHVSLDDSEIERVKTVSDFAEAGSSLLLPPQPIKIPVNFNDSTLSKIAPSLVRSTPSTVLESSRPITPRSALKGARQSLGLEDADSFAVRKVIFSTHETRVDLNGKEEEAMMHSVSSSPEHDAQHDIEEEHPSLSVATLDTPSRKSGLLGWLWGGSKTNCDSTVPASTDGADGAKTRLRTSQVPSSQASPRSRGNGARIRTPSYLLPPSYPSDPARDAEVPMSTSGEFTNTHFRTMHIIYAKSLRPRFHAPQSDQLRPGVKELLGAAFEANESRCGLGVFEWKVDGMALRVLERFMKEIEHGYPAGRKVEWGWTEGQICERLFRIVVGEEVRKEEKAALEKGVA